MNSLLSRLVRADCLPVLRGQRGSAVVIVAVGLAVVSSMVVSQQLLRNYNSNAQLSIQYAGQADQVAMSGITQGITWFRSQAIQPVSSNLSGYSYPDAAFYPRVSAGETLDESVGLVQEYALSTSNSVWGHYEIRRQQDPSSNPIDSLSTHDVTAQRISGQAAGAGLVWQITSTGYVYQRRDASVPYNQSPNRVLATSRMTTEIWRVSQTLPANAAVIVNDRASISTTVRSWIAGNTAAGAAYVTDTSGSISNHVSGTPQSLSIAAVPTAQSIFGVTPSHLKQLADLVLDPSSLLPAGAYPSMALVYVDGDYTFDATKPLQGGGVLYVNGNLTITSAANAVFQGLIFVTGTTTIYAQSSINGTLISLGGLSLLSGGSYGSGVVQINYDSGILDQVRQQITQYRQDKVTRTVFSLS